MTQFFKDIAFSCIKPSFFREIINRKNASGYRYFKWLFRLLGLLTTLVIASWLLNHETKAMGFLKTQIPNITLENKAQQLKFTPPEPMAFLLLSDTIVEINTQKTTLEGRRNLPGRDVIMILKDGIIIKQQWVGAYQLPVSIFPEFTFNSFQLIDLISTNLQISVLIFSAFLFIIVRPFLALHVTILMPFYSIFLWICGKIARTKLTYSQAKIIGYYATTLPILVGTLLLAQKQFAWKFLLLLYFIWSLIGILVNRPKDDAEESTLTLNQPPL